MNPPPPRCSVIRAIARFLGKLDASRSIELLLDANVEVSRGNGVKEGAEVHGALAV
jgi:hypothetical protein